MIAPTRPYGSTSIAPTHHSGIQFDFSPSEGPSELIWRFTGEAHFEVVGVIQDLHRELFSERIIMSPAWSPGFTEFAKEIGKEEVVEVDDRYLADVPPIWILSI